MSHRLKFTIITPTLLRPTLERACKSIEGQNYENWHHIVTIDNPSANPPSNLNHQNRRWRQCAKSHHNVGNTCRSESFGHVPPDTDYILYLDDDNYYLPSALHNLNEGLTKRYLPNWGTFPMNRLGRLFIDAKPRLFHVDTNQIYHKPRIHSNLIQYPAVDDYCGDARLVEWLTSLVAPTVLTNIPPLVNMDTKSIGAPFPDDPFSVVIPNRFPDIIQPLLSSIQDSRLAKPYKIYIVADGHSNSYGHYLIQCTQENFVFSKAANTGINAVGKGDVILVNDDIRLLRLDTFQTLFETAYHDPSIGILSPLIDGGCGNLFMDASNIDKLWNGQRIMYRPGTPSDYISFVCVYLKRQMLDEIGLMDENFTGYSRDDADMCIRAVKAGWKVAVTKNTKVRHGLGGNIYRRGFNWNSSYSRQGINIGDSGSNSKYFFEKYPDALHKRSWPQPYARSHYSPVILSKNSLIDDSKIEPTNG